MVGWEMAKPNYKSGASAQPRRLKSMCLQTAPAETCSRGAMEVRKCASGSTGSNARKRQEHFVSATVNIDRF